MAKPVTLPTVFATLAAPTQSLALFDGNYAPLTASINDIPTYGNYFSDTGAVNALVVTVSPLTFGLTAGTWIDVLVANTNTTTTPTLNVGGTGAKTIVDHTGGALLIGALVAGGVYHFMYDGTNYRSLTATQDSGTFTGTITGCATAPTCTFNWTRNGNLISIDCPVGTQANSNAITCTFTGLPAALQPQRAQQSAITNLYNSGTGGLAGAVYVAPGSGTMTLYLLVASGSNYRYNSSGFTNDNNPKGIGAACAFSYNLG
jgi:hypothetical protein